MCILNNSALWDYEHTPPPTPKKVTPDTIAEVGPAQKTLVPEPVKLLKHCPFSFSAGCVLVPLVISLLCSIQPEKEPEWRRHHESRAFCYATARQCSVQPPDSGWLIRPDSQRGRFARPRSGRSLSPSRNQSWVAALAPPPLPSPHTRFIIPPFTFPLKLCLIRCCPVENRVAEYEKNRGCWSVRIFRKQKWTLLVFHQ